jgi:hypothetical protein
VLIGNLPKENKYRQYIEEAKMDQFIETLEEKARTMGIRHFDATKY